MRKRLTCLLTGLLLACGVSENTHTGTPVIFISIDTLRADHLPMYGYGAVATPALDALRADGILFREAYTHCPMTLPSHVSILTGLLPAEHHVRNNLGYTFDSAKFPSISSELRERGYASGAAVSSYVLRRETGLAAAFDFYDDTMPIDPALSLVHQERNGGATADAALGWISTRVSTMPAQPFFFFLHLYEPHVPYAPPEPFRSRYANAYDGEIAAADAIVGKFLDRLKALGVYDRALIVFFSDHGEGLNDHGEDQHGIFVYRESIHVPLVIKLPKGEKKGTAVDGAVQLADLAPAVLHWLGVRKELPAGRADLIAGAIPERRIYSETYFPLIHLGWSPLRSLIDGSHHYIDAPRPELYDLARDPGEKNDVRVTERRVAAAFAAELERYTAALEPLEAIDPEAARNLAALGYIGSAQTRSDSGALPDPKDRIGDLGKIREAFILAEQRQYDRSAAALRELLRTNPKNIDLWDKLGETLDRAGDSEGAVAAYQEGIRSAPEHAQGLALSLGFLLLKEGKLDEAAAHARLGMAMNASRGHELLARVALARNDAVTAEAEAAASTAGKTPLAADLVLQAEITRGRAQFQRALDLLDAAQRLVAANGGKPVFRLDFIRGDLLARLEQPGPAEQAYRREIAAFPAETQAYANLAVLYFVQGRLHDVDATLAEVMRRNPGRAAREVAVKTYEALELPAKARAIAR
jgi:arylsulfatase A-like enzyme/Flp pilus assembly protein TadD